MWSSGGRFAFMLGLALVWAAASSPAGEDQTAKGSMAGGLDPVLASVGSKVITESDLSYYLLEIRLYDPTMDLLPDSLLRQQIITRVLDEELLYRHFWQADASVPKEDLQEAVEEAWARYLRLAGSRRTLESRITEAGLTPSGVRRWLENQAERNWVIRAGLTAKAGPPPEDSEGDTIPNASQVWISHILVRPEESGEAGWAKAEKEASRVWLRLEEGVDFEQAAALYSDSHSSSDAGGDLGWLDVRGLEPPVRDAILALSPSKFSPPVRTAAGFQILLLNDFQTPVRRDYLERLKEIRSRLLRELRDEGTYQLRSGYELSPLRADEASTEVERWDGILRTGARETRQDEAPPSESREPGLDR